ncbi:unnamed protein product [Mytilus coruscus]|uniref:Uncharacterized protein n=1 Tax=Mytilus coruscus TaxID=42192 RepID=A0A6J8ET70_MYTCO|nr:unnamed protein product [Mytilus coruscus]
MDIKVDIDIDTDSLDLMDDEVRKLNDTRFPLLTLIHRIKLYRESDNFSCLNILLRPNYGNKENFEALKEPIDKCLIEAREQAYQSVLNILDIRVQELNSTISTVLNAGVSFYEINSPPSGETRTKLAKEANNINEEYTLKWRTFITDMRHKSVLTKIALEGRPEKGKKEEPHIPGTRDGIRLKKTNLENKEIINLKTMT